MPNVELYEYQIDAVKHMRNGCILDGGVGTGKSRTSLAYIYTAEMKGQLKVNGKGEWQKPKVNKDLYIITTAKKRDSLEWDKELIPFGLSTNQKLSVNHIKCTVDSWNNIQKYKNIYGAIFIFDEQRVTGSGPWVKAFIRVTTRNRWVLLSATPGDAWKDYIPVFVANGFYKNKTQFYQMHVILKPYRNYPSIDRYVNEWLLDKHRSDILVHMEPPKVNKKEIKKIFCSYDRDTYKRVFKDRWDVYDNCPVRESGKLCYLLRRVSNENQSRIDTVESILREHKKAIIFYNFSTELILLRALAKRLGYDIGEWNGEVHSQVPTTKAWVYLCQYNAASEGWNCITTDTLIFYSLNYSYRMMTQAAGRIDRANTPFDLLYYYYLQSHSPIDLAISKALAQKKDFNIRGFIGGLK